MTRSIAAHKVRRRHKTGRCFFHKGSLPRFQPIVNNLVHIFKNFCKALALTA